MKELHKYRQRSWTICLLELLVRSRDLRDGEDLYGWGLWSGKDLGKVDASECWNAVPDRGCLRDGG